MLSDFIIIEILPLIFCIFHGVGGRVDDSAVFADGIINIDEDQPTYTEQDAIGPDGCRKQVGEHYAADAEKDDKVAGEEHPAEDSPASDLPKGGEGVTVEVVIGGIEIVRHQGGMEKKDINSNRREPIGWEAYGEEGNIARYNPAAEIARVEQRRMTPGDGYACNVEIGERQCHCHRRTGLAPMEMIVEEQTYAEDGKEDCREHSRTVVHGVMAIGVVVYQQAYCHSKVKRPHYQQ